MRKIRNDKYVELLILLVASVIIYFISTMQVKNMMTIWNQNDEFGVWQGAAWILGLDWSEVSSNNGFYGQGYGYLLAPIMYFWGHDSIKMTHIAIYFQAFYHTGILYIAYYCTKKLFPQINSILQIIISCLSIISIPDLFYIYMFFSENLLRFLVWCMIGLVISYISNQRWYKLLLINAISIYAFSVHQRCILLVAMAGLFYFIECIRSLKVNEKKMITLLNIVLISIITIILYLFVYKYSQNMYISSMYSAAKEGVGGNLLSERNVSIQDIVMLLVNANTIKIMFQQLCGCIYYFTAYDCGFALFGFMGVLLLIKDKKKKLLSYNVFPYIFISCLALGAVGLTVVQNSQSGISNRVEVNHYGRYFSYTLGPMIMLGLGFLFSYDYKLKKKIIITNMLVFIFAGVVTYNMINWNNVTSLFAFSNACPGINSVYSSDGPKTATLYHILIGIIWIFIPSVLILFANKYNKLSNMILTFTFLAVATIWICIGNRESINQYNAQKQYVVDTYDLQYVLSEQTEIVVYKANKYGSGLIQYNNVYSKIYVCNDLSQLKEYGKKVCVVSQNGIDEMNQIKSEYEVIFSNNRYFVWIYE